MNHIRSIMLNSALIPRCVLLWWQRKTWKSVAHPSDVFFLTTTDSKCWCAIMRSEKTHTLACNEFFGTQWIMDAAARSDAMNTPATNSSACNELRMRQRDRVQWMTAADAPSCGQKRHTHWPATNSSACNDSRMRQRIVCNELRLLIRHRAVRKDTHAGPQRIPSADVPSCGQKRHTRWRATNSGWWCEFVPSETCQRMLGLKDFRVKQT